MIFTLLYQPSEDLIDISKAIKLSLFKNNSSKKGATGFPKWIYLKIKIGNKNNKKFTGENKNIFFNDFLFLKQKNTKIIKPKTT